MNEIKKRRNTFCKQNQYVEEKSFMHASHRRRWWWWRENDQIIIRSDLITHFNDDDDDDQWMDVSNCYFRWKKIKLNKCN